MKKRVVHITTVHPYNDTRIFHKECKSLAKDGYEVFLVAPKKENEIIDGVNILALPQNCNRFIRITFLTMKSYVIARELNADIYHFHDPELMLVGLLLRVVGKKVIYDIHEDVPRSIIGSPRSYLPKWARKPWALIIELFENIACPNYSALITVTKYIKNRFSSLNKRVALIQNYPIHNELTLNSKIHWKDKKNLVAYVGSLSKGRGLIQMIKAMGYVPSGYEAMLKIAGKITNVNEKMYGSLAKINGWSSVEYLGYQNRMEIAGLLGEAKAGLVLFHPQPNHINAQPNKLFEYMSAGIPVIASNFILWQKIVDENKCGITVDPLDHLAIAESIKYIFDNPYEAEQMGQNGRRLIIEKYNWESQAEKLIELYNTLLDD